VVLGKPLTLGCEAAGHPPPSLTWLKDGVPVQDREGVRVAQRGATIEIAAAAVADAGHYVCVATSIAGEKAIKYDVHVLGMRTHANTHTCAHTHTHIHARAHTVLNCVGLTSCRR